MHRPGSAAITASFFAELSDVLDRLSTYTDPLVLAGDLNIPLKCTADPYTVQFCELLYSYGLVQLVHDVTHDAGGTLDVVCSRSDLPCLSVDVHEIGLSDHHLLCWTAPFCRPDPLYLTADHRLWRSFSLDAFLSALQASALCDEQQFQQLDGDALVQLYDDTVTARLNEQIPVHCVSYRVRASSLWFHEECHTAKRALRLTERELLVMLVFPRTPALLPLLPTTPSTTVMSPSCVRRSPHSGPSASMLSNCSHVSSGGRLINCTAEANSFVIWLAAWRSG